MAAVTVMLVALAAPTAAMAGTAELRTVVLPYGTGADLTYRAAPGERNQVEISVDAPVWTGEGFTRVVRLEDQAGIAPGAGCEPAADAGGTAVICSLGGFLHRARILLGDRDDSAVIEGQPEYVELVGGGGNDTLRGGSFYTHLVGGAGNDRMFGTGFVDVFDEGRRPNGSDSMTSLEGVAVLPSAWVDYGARRRPVHADLAGDRDDGERGERDRIAGGIDSILGGWGNDRLVGAVGDDALVGGFGSDVLAGRAGDDALIASPLSRRRLMPGSLLPPGKTSDRLFGGPGRDLLEGSAGPNLLRGGSGADAIWAMEGADRIREIDGDLDEIRCGDGRDIIREDPIDFRIQCERTRSRLEGGIPVALEPLVRDRYFDAGGPYSALIIFRCSGNQGPPCSGSVRLELDGAPLGETRFQVDDSFDSTGVEISVTQEVLQLLEHRDPRITVVVARDRVRPRRIRVSLPHLARDGLGALPLAPLRWWR